MATDDLQRPLDAGGFAISNVANPTGPQDVATRFYSDNLVNVKSIKADANPALNGNVVLVSGSNVTLSQVGQQITVSSSGVVDFNKMLLTSAGTIVYKGDGDILLKQ